jgi:hypothetical protein
MNSDKDLVVIYGFSFKYPIDAKLEFNPKSDRCKGDLAIKFQNGFKIFITWGELKELPKSVKGLEDLFVFHLNLLKKKFNKIELVSKQIYEINNVEVISIVIKVKDIL